MRLGLNIKPKVALPAVLKKRRLFMVTPGPVCEPEPIDGNVYAAEQGELI